MIVAGEAFNVLVEGEEGAPVLILAHSLGTNLHLFDKLMPELLRHFRVVRYDSRGHGASVVSPGPYSIGQLGQDALRILDALQVEKAHWLGISKGGAVGLWLLTHAPERIGRAVLANVGAQIGSSDMWNERINTVREKGIESLAPATLENWFTRGFRESHSDEVDHYWEMLLSTPAEGYVGACAALRDMDQRESIRTIANPVLVVVGRHDPITPPGVGALVASAVPGAKLVTLETAHLSCVEDPAGFGQAALEFLTAEETAMEEEAPQEVVEEVSQIPAPAKKPRKPRAPRKAPPTIEAQGEIMPSAEVMPEAAAEPEPEHAPEVEPMEMAVPPAPPPRKPRHRRPAAVALVPEPIISVEPPVIAVAAPHPRKRPAKKAPAKKAVAKKAASKKVTAKKVAAKKLPVRKAATKKAATKKVAVKKTAVKKAAMKKARAVAPARKAVTKKTVAKKPVAKKAVGKKAVGKKVVAKKIVAKKIVAKKVMAKKVVGKKAPMRKSAAKKAIVRKAVVKKTQAKKAAVKKTAMKKAGGRKALPRHMPGRRPSPRKR